MTWRGVRGELRIFVGMVSHVAFLGFCTLLTVPLVFILYVAITSLPIEYECLQASRKHPDVHWLRGGCATHDPWGRWIPYQSPAKDGS